MAPKDPVWIRCPECEDFWCLEHQDHAYDCECPPVEEWEGSPYVPDVPDPLPSTED